MIMDPGIEMNLFQITLAQWHGEGYEEVYKKFQRSVILRTSQPPWNNNDAILMNQTVGILLNALSLDLFVVMIEE